MEDETRPVESFILRSNKTRTRECLLMETERVANQGVHSCRQHGAVQSYRRTQVVPLPWRALLIWSRHHVGGVNCFTWTQAFLDGRWVSRTLVLARRARAVGRQVRKKQRSILSWLSRGGRRRRTGKPTHVCQTFLYFHVAIALDFHLPHNTDTSPTRDELVARSGVSE